MLQSQVHQYIRREDRRIQTEKLFGARLIHFLYSPKREESSPLFRALTASWMSSLLAFWNFDVALQARIRGFPEFLARLDIDLGDALENPRALDTFRKVFERKIRYWESRPMDEDPERIAAPSDARMLFGSLWESSLLYIKGKFFDLRELVGEKWEGAFREGDFAVFRLTPEKYHYNHVPVSGRILDLYSIEGTYHSCNPSAVIVVPTPYSKNKRVVSILDTDVPGGTGIGQVAMVEIVALMIGEIVQRYSDRRYELPRKLEPGMFLRKGQPKSLFRPGSSTVLLLFERGKIEFLPDLVANQRNGEVQSRFTRRWGIPLTETEVKVRAGIARRVG